MKFGSGAMEIKSLYKKNAMSQIIWQAYGVKSCVIKRLPILYSSRVLFLRIDDLVWVINN